MRSALSSAATRRFWVSRGAALAVIVVLHVAVVVAALTMKAPRADIQQQASLVTVLLLNDPVEPSRPPEIRVQPPELQPVQVVVQLVDIVLPLPGPTISVAAVAKPEPAPAPAAVKVSVGDADIPVSISQVNWLRKPNPVYPAAASRARAQGEVLVRALVDTTGHALKAVVHRSSGFAALDRAACDAVLAALFKPYLLNGVPRSMEVIVPIAFGLKVRSGGDRRAARGRDHAEDGLQLDVRGENHHAMRGHPEELGSLGTAALHVGE